MEKGLAWWKERALDMAHAINDCDSVRAFQSVKEVIEEEKLLNKQ